MFIAALFTTVLFTTSTTWELNSPVHPLLSSPPTHHIWLRGEGSQVSNLRVLYLKDPHLTNTDFQPGSPSSSLFRRELRPGEGKWLRRTCKSGEVQEVSSGILLSLPGLRPSSALSLVEDDVSSHPTFRFLHFHKTVQTSEASRSSYWMLWTASGHRRQEKDDSRLLPTVPGTRGMAS